MGEGRKVKALQKSVVAVSALEPEIEKLSDDKLRAKTDEFRERLAEGETLDDILQESFAVVREASRRTLEMRPFDVQVMGGIVLHEGKIAEMKTGEGKTLAATMPVYLNALEDKGVHVVTVNDYLARRDAQWMGEIYELLGLTVGLIQDGHGSEERKVAYSADITYGTNAQFGFDYLRDNIATHVDHLVQRELNYAIVDEVDSILIDEARTPLIISGMPESAADTYYRFAEIVPRLKAGEDYEVDEKKRQVAPTESGVEKVEKFLGVENLYDDVNTNLVNHLNQALRAHTLFRDDVEYIVRDGEVFIVDEFTGRVLEGRRYSEGLHQAIEAKEAVEIKEENQTVATITIQNYFRQYDKLAGMTGTAATEADEFMHIYKMGVVSIPTHMPMIREDRDDLVYKVKNAKYNAVVEDIVERHQRGQPILVGTVSVEVSEHLSTLLKRRGINHNVLNAKHHEREAEIIAEAGKKGAVTIATNMAGRGTDIKLGGSDESDGHEEWTEQHERLAQDIMQEYPTVTRDMLEGRSLESLEVLDLGGLYVLGTERHESRRIDNQLRGRSGRQGDPGESRFYLSFEDDLLRLFNSGIVETFLNAAKIPDDVPIEAKMVTRAIASAQSQIEARNFEIRKNVLKYDDVLNRQREVIYGERRRVLQGADLHEQIRHFIDDVVRAYVVQATGEGYSGDWDLEQLWRALKLLYPVGISVEELLEEAGGPEGVTQDMLVRELTSDAQLAYDRREEALGGEAMREFERRVVLSVLDRKWREHLYEMDYLQEGIGLRAMAQRDPLVEYQREGYQLFQAMTEAIKEESVSYLFNLEVEVEAPAEEEQQTQGEGATVLVAKGLVAPQRPARLQYSAPTVDGEGGVETHSEGSGAGDGVAAAAPAARADGSGNRAARRA